MTFPAASDTVAALGTTQTFTRPNTFSPGANAGVALTATSTTNATPNDALDVNLANTSGTATNGLLVNQTGAGTVTNGLNVTQGASGVITNALRFIGTFTNLINATNYSVLNSGAVSSAADTVTSSSANALAVGANGATNPAFNVDASTASSATGLNVKSAAAAGGLAVSVISSGAAENLTLDAKGTGTITLAGTSTGNISLARNTSITGTETITSSNAAAFGVGTAGATNPAFNVDASTASSVTGLNVKSAASGGGLAVSTISSAAAENLTIDAKSTGTITLNGTGTGNVITGANLVPAAGKNITINSTGGLVGASAIPTGAAGLFWTGNIPYTTLTGGNDTANTNGDIYWAPVYIPQNVTLTGVTFSIGSVGGTDKAIAALYNSAGTLLANSATAGTTVGTANTFQSLAFTGTYAAVGPGVYYVAMQFNGTTAKFRAHTLAGYVFAANSQAGTFGTLASITPGTTYTANKGPIAFVY